MDYFNKVRGFPSLSQHGICNARCVTNQIAVYTLLAVVCKSPSLSYKES